MTRLLAHRGPDGERVSVVSRDPGPTVVFGQRRLAIIDVSPAGMQPMNNEDGAVVSVFNGEIYNFRELRRDLASAGHRFRSESDTEVIVHAYEQFGDDFVKRLDGMFALALWDDRRKRLLLARDRAGKKPLYYSLDGSRVTFASEIKSLRTCPWIDASLNWGHLPEFLVFGYIPWPATMHRSIVQVPPACVVVIEEETVRAPTPYWSLRFDESPEKSSPAEWREMTRILVRNAVEKRLVSDVPVGVLLSGGLDSSIVVQTMVELGADLRTFTVGFDDDDSFDERPYARAFAQRVGADHTEEVIRPDVVSLIERLTWHVDQPFGDSSIIPTYLVNHVASDHVKVVLTGDGGDEVFAGYERFAAAMLAAALPRSTQRGLSSFTRFVPRRGGYFDLRARLERFFSDPNASPEERYLGWMTIFDRNDLQAVVNEDALDASASVPHPASSFWEAVREAPDGPLLDRLLHVNFRTYLHDDLLVKIDRASMASSVEARSPFLDTALIEGIANVPSAAKADPFRVKKLLRSAFEPSLPREVVRRRKHGFGVPVDRWFRGPLTDMYRDLVTASDSRTGPLLQPGVAGRLIDEHNEHIRDHGPRLWLLLSLEMWARMIETPPIDTSGAVPGA